MALSFQCPCGQPFQVEPTHLGSTVRCPACGRGLLLPALGRLESSSVQSRPPHHPAQAHLPWWTLSVLPLAVVALLALTGLTLFVTRAIHRAPDVSPSSPTAFAVAGTFPQRVASSPAPPRDTLSARAKESAEHRVAPPAVVRTEAPPGPGPAAVRPTPSQQPSTSISEPTRPPMLGRLTGFQVGDRFYQEVIVGRVTACQAPGIDFRDNAQFAYLSSLRVEKVTGNGAVVAQKVEAVRLDQADADGREELGALLRKTKGVTFKIHLSPDGDVTRLDGAPNGVGTWSSRGGDGLSLSLRSTLDADAWKELAQLTFFRPRGSPGNNGRWSRALTHDWGSLGRWSGQVTYQPGPRAKNGLDRYDYALDLAYKPPKKGAGGLPFAVDRAGFRLVAGGGSIAYDRSRDRVTAAEERFQVRGLLEASALGVTVPVGMEEVQVFQLRLLDKMPDPERWSAARP
jgi:hypothetical protein